MIGDDGYHVRNDALLFFLSVGLVFLSRLPFLNLGYGTQPDAWRVALTARSIALTGEYSASRLPGYPVQEILCSLLWRGGPWALNGMTAIFSGIAVGFFLLSMKLLGSKDYIAGGLALAFVPIIYINSTMSLDNIWALAFILGALYFILVGRSVAAGFFLGFAIGCRITSGAMIIPLSLLLAQGKTREAAARQVLGLCLIAGTIGAIAFTPVVAKYGWSFFTFYEPLGYPPLLESATRGTVDVWGRVGLLGLLMATVYYFINPGKLRTTNIEGAPKAGIQFTAWMIAITLYVIVYLRLPHQARYLIPVVPFVILVFERILHRRAFLILCMMLLFSSFVGFGRSGIYAGPIFLDYAARKADMEFTARVISQANLLQKKAVIVTGWWLPKIEGSLPTQAQDLVAYVYLLDATQLRQHIREGFTVYYLPGIRDFNRRIFGLNLAEFGATPLLPDETDELTMQTR